MRPGALDYYATDPSILADDWLCMDGLPITDIHWWGSYLAFEENSPTPLIDPRHPDQFSFSMHLDVAADDPANNFGYSFPGSQVNGALANLTDYTVNYFGTIDHGDFFEHIYQYNFLLPEPWLQQMGQIYWLDISALYDPIAPTETPWGWHQAITQFGDDAVINVTFDPFWFPIDSDNKINLAFELSTVPEPGVMLLFGFGSVLWVFRRLRK